MGGVLAFAGNAESLGSNAVPGISRAIAADLYGWKYAETIVQVGRQIELAELGADGGELALDAGCIIESAHVAEDHVENQRGAESVRVIDGGGVASLVGRAAGAGIGDISKTVETGGTAPSL